ncbi:YIP1 family protein [Terracidiphilus gabretensis]|uniref:YIP1 family protein n=1 Tax=Terracidiphilus gabretensis TaxID=1577687 RepID=UPI00071B10C1|nr:YIP1 family protein [Terracidiphilus gabretensis]
MSDPIVQPVSELISPPGPRLSQIQRVIYTFTAPSKTFNDIKAGNRSWWMPWLIGLLVGYLFFAAVYTKIGMRQVAENSIHMNAKQEARMADMPADQRETSMKVTVYITEGVFLAGPVLLLAIVAITSLVLMGTINFVFGGKASYGSIYCVSMYASLIGVIQALLGIIVVFASSAPESFNINNFAPTNIAAFLSAIDTNKALYALLKSLDVITIWNLALTSIGIAIVAGVKKTSGYISVFSWWAVMVLIGIGVAVATS